MKNITSQGCREDNLKHVFFGFTEYLVHAIDFIANVVNLQWL